MFHSKKAVEFRMLVIAISALVALGAIVWIGSSLAGGAGKKVTGQLDVPTPAESIYDALSKFGQVGTCYDDSRGAQTLNPGDNEVCWSPPSTYGKKGTIWSSGSYVCPEEYIVKNVIYELELANKDYVQVTNDGGALITYLGPAPVYDKDGNQVGGGGPATTLEPKTADLENYNTRSVIFGVAVKEDKYRHYSQNKGIVIKGIQCAPFVDYGAALTVYESTYMGQSGYLTAVCVSTSKNFCGGETNNVQLSVMLRPTGWQTGTGSPIWTASAENCGTATVTKELTVWAMEAAGVKAGTYEITCEADPGNLIRENDESNNKAYRAYTLK